MKRCSVHLIIMMALRNNVTIEWGVSTPDQVDASEVANNFVCTLNENKAVDCKFL